MAGASFRLRPRAAPKPSPSSAPRTRRPRKRIYYNEDGTDSDTFNGSISQDDHAEPSPVARPRKTDTPSTRTSPRTTKKRKASAKSRGNPVVAAKRPKLSTAQMKHEKRGSDQEALQLTGRPMPWTGLPYYILASIFAYASHPLLSSTGEPSPSVAWLLQMALVCKAFTEPALSALYEKPPIYTPRQIHKLTAMLENQNEGSTLNYRGKIRYLSISPMYGLLKYPQSIESIIPLTSGLRGIALGIHSDDPKLCRLHTMPSINSSREDMSMFSTLTNARTKLEHWSWNRTLAFHYHPLSLVKEVHLSTPFLTLKSLTFIDFHLPATIDYNGTETLGEEALADALSALPSLQKIRFSLADVVNERLMPLLPGNLQTLVLTSCYNLFSPALEKFLAAKGQNIRELVLSHNQSLNLSFLTDLSHACPKLEILKMNLLYYNSHTTFNDSTPRYDSLLGDGEQPSWPASLRHVELLQLRRWKRPVAERFFSSFADHAESLPNLRHIEIKASIDESGWRDRIAFRDKWVRRLMEVFSRRSPPPKAHLQSFAAYRKWKAQLARLNKVEKATASTQLADGSDISPTPDHNDSDTPITNVRRSGRAHSRREVAYNESDSERSGRGWGGSENFSSKATALTEDPNRGSRQPMRAVHGEPGYVQGLCDVVDVVIDNLRPTEEQLHESDFLDEERSGDEDWNGDDDMDVERYAW